MSCRRAQEIDLIVFTAERRGPEWASFRDHYPRCPDCSTAVARIGEVTSRLSSLGPAAAHLSDDQLLAYETHELAAAEVSHLESHLAGCAACRTELAVLRRFEPEAAWAGDPARARPATSRLAGALEALQEQLASLLRPAPVFGVASALAVALLVVWTLPRDELETTPTRYVEQPAPPAVAPDVIPDGSGEATPVEGSQLAEAVGATPLTVEPLPPARPHAPGPREELRVAETPGTAPEVPRPRIPGREEAPPAPEPTGEQGGEREVMLLAALLPSELPRYGGPGGLAGDELAVRRTGVMLRGASGERTLLSVLAPEHTGVTRQASPRLYWAVDRTIAGPVEIVVNDPGADEPALAKRVAGPFAAGLHSLDLAAEGVSLRVGLEYEWSVALPAEGAARAQDLVALAGIRRTAPEEESAAATTANPAERARRVHRLAAEGDWYDAFDQANRWLEQVPDLERVHAYRRALLEQVALDPVIDWIEGAAAPGG